MIFLTVGTQFPFDRLVKAVDDIIGKGAIKDEIFGQIGESSYKPRNFKSAAYLKKDVFDKYLNEATALISHAGVGTITMAIDLHKPLLVMPRLKRYREVVNDHQAAIARKLEELGHILAAYNEDELPNKIQMLYSFVPKERISNSSAVIQRIQSFLNCLCNTDKPNN